MAGTEDTWAKVADDMARWHVEAYGHPAHARPSSRAIEHAALLLRMRALVEAEAAVWDTFVEDMRQALQAEATQREAEGR